jgi:GNAT superfamily N-acetyltransferase
MTYKYRAAQPSDAIACSQIIRDWGDETSWMVPIDHLESMAQFWGDLFETDLAWVAETDERIVGFCARCDDNIAALYVAPEARNLGVGKALLDLAKADRDWITVWAYEKNEKARRFYRREGLIEISREMEIFDDGSSLMDVEHRWNRSP